jgi:hypothetical protein
MVPVISDGDYALTKLLHPRAKLKVGDVLQVDHPNLGMIVKVVKKIRDEKVLLSGASLVSAEPTTIGWIHKSRVKSRLCIRISNNGLSKIRSYQSGAPI